MGTTVNTFLAAMKEVYAPGPLANLAYQKNVATGLMKKGNMNTQGGGIEWNQPVRSALPGGGSTDFGTAIAASNNQSDLQNFKVQRVKHFRFGKVDMEVLRSTKTMEEAYEPAFREFDRGLEAEGNWQNFRFFRSRGGAIGQMTNTTFNTAIMTLDDSAGTWAVKKGDVIGLSTSDGTAAGTLKTGSLTVASVQRVAGTITFTGNISAGIATAAASDFVFMAGDYANGSSFSPAGLADWVPSTSPTNTLFFNVDRSTEPDLLGGLRIDATNGKPVHEVLVDMAAQAENVAADTDIVIGNPFTLGTFAKQLTGKWVINPGQDFDGSTLEVGYNGFEAELLGRRMTIYADRTCQRNRLWGLTLDSWTMFSAGPWPAFLYNEEETGFPPFMPSQGSDAFQALIGGYGNFSCDRPGHNINVQMPNA